MWPVLARETRLLGFSALLWGLLSPLCHAGSQQTAFGPHEAF